MDTRQQDPGPAGGTDQQDPPAPGSTPRGPRVTAEEVRDVRRLRRSRTDRKLAGVCGGIARHLDVDPLLVRVLMVVLVFFGGSGLLLYLAGWVLVPEDESESRPLGLDDRNRGFAILAVLVLAALALLGDVTGAYWSPWPLLVIALAVALLVGAFGRSGSGSVPASGAAAGVPGAPGSPTPAGWTPPPPDPRRRGPLLFWPTVALAAFAVGVLGVIDLAGVDVPPSGYPALALLVTAVALVVGSTWGRAGGLIALGLLLALVTAVTTATERFDSERTLITPTSASEVQDTYQFGAAEMVLDLSDIEDVDGLDGHDILAEGGVGRIEVVLPRGMDVPIDARVGGPGDISLLDKHGGGIATELRAFQDGGDEVPDLRIRTQLGVGEIVVHDGPAPFETGADR